MINYSGKLQQLLCLITCVLMVVAVSIRRDGKVAGKELNQQKKASPKTETMVVLEDGSVRLNTTELGKDIIGYGGTVPLEITLQDGRVKNIKALANSESPEFFGEASALLSKWDGQTIEDAQKNESGRGDWCDILLQGYHRKRTARTSVCGKESRKGVCICSV